MPDDNPTPTSGPEGAPASTEEPGAPQRGKLRDLANTALQSAVDRSTALITQGRFDELDPKMVEFLSNPAVLENIGVARRPSSNDDETPEIPADVARYAKIGQQATAASALAKIEGEVRGKVLQDEWVSDAKELFAEFHDAEISVKEFAAIDPTDRKAFPLTSEGYRRWKVAANQFRAARYKAATSEPDAGDASVNADREAATAGTRRPQPKSAGGGPTTEIAKAKDVLQGKGKEAYREMLRSRGLGI